MKKAIAAFAALSMMLVACTDSGGGTTGDTGSETTLPAATTAAG